jgi:hypothetical protein
VKTYTTTKQSNGKLKRGPMVSVPTREYSKPVPDSILELIDSGLLVLDDNDHGYTIYHDGHAVAFAWGPSVEDEWFYRIGHKPEDAHRVPARDDALKAALLPSLAKAHEWQGLIPSGTICLTCSPKEGEEGYSDPATMVEWPCPPLRAAGMTDEQAKEHIRKCLASDAERRAALHSLVKTHEYDELIFGGFMCLTCSPKEGEEGYGEVETTVGWPCPPLRAAGMTDEQAVEHIKARRAAIEAAAKARAEKEAATDA